ncbi:MAG: hypothetical protein JW809_10190 [Pirellulales bacterium]|nr:hypothetical protein [Pirellulales bacterium]
MDRLHWILLPRRAAPLATLGLAGLLAIGLLAVPPGSPRTVVSHPTTPRPQSDAAPRPPRVLPSVEPAALVERPPRRDQPLQPVEFPCDETATAGPLLVAPSSPPTSPVEPPAPLVPPADAKPARPSEPSLAATPPPPPAASPLWTEFEPLARSDQMEQIAREADRHTRHGFELASKKAFFSARAEFIQALRLIAQGLDVERRTRVHGQSLADAIAAMDEADDFLPTGSHLEAQLDLPGIVAGHRTPALKDVRPEDLNACEALRRYFRFAQEQFSVAAGGEVAGSMALHALGKLSAARAGQMPAAEPKAVTFYQAALVVCPENALAANDLGVLLARAGRLADAQAVFQHSLAIQDHPTTRHNLALVASRTGGYPHFRASDNGTVPLDPRAPVAATSHAAGGPPSPDPTQLVRWIQPDEFARSYGQTPDARQPPPPAPPVATPSPPPSAPASQADRPSGFWSKFLFGGKKKPMTSPLPSGRGAGGEGAARF